MNDLFDVLTASGDQRIETLSECNALTGRYGLSLTQKQVIALEKHQREAAAAAGRAEFGGGALRAIIEAFCDSPYIQQDSYEETLSELVASFYYFKTEAEDRIADDELIAYMRRCFDTTCQGSLEYLSGTTLEELCRDARGGREADDSDTDGRPF